MSQRQIYQVNDFSSIGQNLREQEVYMLWNQSAKQVMKGYGILAFLYEMLKFISYPTLIVANRSDSFFNKTHSPHSFISKYLVKTYRINLCLIKRNVILGGVITNMQKEYTNFSYVSFLEVYV